MPALFYFYLSMFGRIAVAVLTLGLSRANPASKSGAKQDLSRKKIIFYTRIFSRAYRNIKNVKNSFV